MMNIKVVFSVTIMLGEFICLSYGVPLRKISVAAPDRDSVSRSKRDDASRENLLSENAEIEFPDNNYDYEFPDVGDLFEYIIPASEHSTVKRYSDAIATDRLSRYERLKLLKARDQFLQFLLGASKRSSESSLTGLVQMLNEKRQPGDGSDAVNELMQRLGLLNYIEQNSAGTRGRRHAPGVLNHLSGMYRQAKTLEKLGTIEQVLKGKSKRETRGYDDYPDIFPHTLKLLLTRPSR